MAKDFGVIENDYAFFMAHATEAEQDVSAYARALQRFAGGRAAIRMLDFGCGDGGFTERFLAAMSWSPEMLELALVEPVDKQLKLAAKRVVRFTRQPIECARTLPEQVLRRFDLIVSNHVLYYVEDVDATLRQLADVLAPGGTMLLALAGWDNVLMELWTAGFALLGEGVPYYAAEDVEAGLSRLGLGFEKSKCPYRLRFPDSRENRLRILRFLFADHLRRLPVERMLAEFDRHVVGENVDVSTHSYHFAVALAPL